jgi:hypothetical protein
MSNKLNNFLKSIDTVSGHCQHCGEDTKQYINGSIRYIKLTQEDEQWLKRQKVSE